LCPSQLEGGWEQRGSRLQGPGHLTALKDTPEDEAGGVGQCTMIQCVSAGRYGNSSVCEMEKFSKFYIFLFNVWPNRL
jgi:hypothetical protein